MRRNRYVIDVDDRIGATQILLLCLFATGIISLILFLFWVIASFAFVFGEAAHPGDIAYLPKWIFLLAPLSLLGYSRKLKPILEKF